MAGEMHADSARWLEWVLRRNPLYLMSAVLMAVGARLFLVDPTNAPGDIQLILLTLIALQAYEWAASGILVLLHRHRRSLEDKPSLLLVAVLFWTGPMAATIEMTALRADVGVVLAAGVCLIALGELRFVERALGLRISGAAKFVSSACVILLAAAPPFLRVPEGGPRSNELYLYAVWWALAGIAFSSLGPIRVDKRSKIEAGTGSAAIMLNGEIAFLALSIGTTALHVAGMNYAFFCHAAWFYASPLMIAMAIVSGEYLIQTGRKHYAVLLLVNILPVIAILLAIKPFNPHVPVDVLPRWLRDPMLSTSLIAAGAWWLIFIRHKDVAAFHLGSASFAWAIYRAANLVSFRADGVADVALAGSSARNVLAIVFFIAAGYFVLFALVRRRRLEAFLAIVANLLAVSVMVWERVPADVFIVCLAAGWSWLIGTHLAVRRPPMLFQVFPVGFLFAVTCVYDFDPALAWGARAHGLIMIATLFLAGAVWRSTAHRRIVGMLAAVYAGFLLYRWTGELGNPLAAAAVTGAFALLLMGAALSWHKQRLLAWSLRSNQEGATRDIEI